MQNFPVFMNLRQQVCLVVGGGGIALRKIRLLRMADAHIKLVAPEICRELREEFGDQIGNEIQIHERPFEDKDLIGNRLIIAATNNEELNAHISKNAQSKNIPVNVVDSPALCSFITPSIVDRDPVTIAISTGGGAPVLARFLRSRLESFIPATYGRLASTMSGLRDRVKQRFPEETQRRRFWEKIVNGPISESFLSGSESQAMSLIEKELSQDNNEDNEIGEVWLIGAGPGDPDLLTFRALRLMQQADVVLHDRLVIRRDADRIYVGKKRSEHAVPQGDINQLLVDLALEGKRVVRLKGGDPFIFGRGGEEIELLAKSGVPFQIVPGITAASGCATYAGIPLTHRDHAQSCVFVTGHLKDGSINLDWDLLATPNQTVVVYMGLVGLPVICEKLIEHGVSKDMPIALVEQGTTNQQRTFTGTIGTLAEQIKGKDIHAPTLIIIGTVVTLHDELAWFNT